MKNLIKLAAVGVAGYFIGFYELKYRVMKIALEDYAKDDSKESQKEEESK